MGQYYRPVLFYGEKTTIYNRDVDENYTMAKLLEHSWWENPLMNAISDKLYQKKSRLIWCGDYAEDEEVAMTNLTVKDIWDCDGEGVKSTDFRIDNLYLCNHELQEYIDLSKYKKNCIDNDGWVIHPLSLLTAIGNGRGGGDYHDCYPNADKVGIWAWNLISLEEKVPENYVEYEIIFKES